MYKYANKEETGITNTGTGSFIPVGHRIYNELIEAGETIYPFETEEEQAARESAEVKQAFIDQQKKDQMTGIEINGVMCSATKDDQNGLMAVLQDFNFYKSFNDGDGSGWAYFGFQFKNGGILDINEALIADIFLIWGSFRKEVTRPYES